ncbi:ATP-binding protein [Muribacter muris]|uniref:ATP-binding protein n=1 Tax=Muribacter muris TaxID=67855 RepID=A0A4Y9K5A4_9PAST|nr:AAA family ATPase [Muribacter muris]MBF0784225.1 AAA family ATPase [Muribacter muris]MBF0827037.1 AAA family ATPase [Muribacter muris]TFV12968.1 ATP-binding protein [Muribacter muris]
MLKRMQLKNFTVFNDVNLEFSSGLNVIIGENGMGKSHLLKVAYSMIASSFEQSKGLNVISPTKSLMQKAYADKLVNVFRPESLGRLVRRKQGRERCEITLEFKNKEQNCGLSFSTNSKTEVQIEKLNHSWQDKAPVYLPTRELLTIYPNFTTIYKNNYLEYDETYYDTCILLGALLAKGPREEKIKELLLPLEEEMGGKIILDKNGHFYIQGQGKMEMPLVAEGLRKLAMIARLIATGALLDKGILFWDEPEANLNPKLIKVIAKTILHLCRNGIQVFIATHSLFLLRELEILSKQSDFNGVSQRYLGLKSSKDGITIEQGNEIYDIETLTVLNESLMQSDRYLNL